MSDIRIEFAQKIERILREKNGIYVLHCRVAKMDKDRLSNLCLCIKPHLLMHELLGEVENELSGRNMLLLHFDGPNIDFSISKPRQTTLVSLQIRRHFVLIARVDGGATR